MQTAQKSTADLRVAQEAPSHGLPAMQGHKELRSPPRVSPIIPQTYAEVEKLAESIAKAGWAPKSYMIDPKKWDSGFSVPKISVAILHGMEVGFTPIAALQSIAIINNTPTIWGDGALALVQASGLCGDFSEGPILDKDGKLIGYECFAWRKDRKTPITHKFTLEMASKAKLLGKEGPWQLYPSRMLQMRARAWVLRDGFADVLRGLAIREEVEDWMQGSDGSWSPPAGSFKEPPIESSTATAQDQAATDSKSNAKSEESTASVGTIELITGDGEVHTFERPSAYADAFIAEVQALRASKDQLEGFLESNSEVVHTLKTTAPEEIKRIVEAVQEARSETKVESDPAPKQEVAESLRIEMPMTAGGTPNLMAYTRRFREAVDALDSTAAAAAFAAANDEVLKGLPERTRGILERDIEEAKLRLNSEGR